MGLASLAAASQSLWMACLVFVIVGLGWAYSPRGYVVSEESIRVKRLIGPATLPLAGVREVRRAGSEDFRGSIRLFGSGGLFGYYGLFSTSRLGKSYWYVTDRSKAVVVVTAAKTAVFSPDDVEGFIAAIGVPENPATGPSAEARRPLRGILIGLAAGAAVIVFVILTLYYSPGLPAYTLTRDTLAIHDKFYPVTLGARDVDVERIRVVDLREEGGWRPTMRTNGFGNLRYHSGWFRAANGQRVRLYRESGTRLVLLPPKGDGAPVLYEVKEPEEFVRRVRRQWAQRLRCAVAAEQPRLAPAYGASTSTNPSDRPPAAAGCNAPSLTVTFCGPV